MILEKSHLKAMVERLKAFAKVNVPSSKPEEYLEKLLTKIFAYIDCFNSLGEYAVQVFDIPLSDIPVLGEFKDFILPKSVKIDAADLDCVEMLVLEPLNLKGLDYADYLNALMDFRSLFKSDLTSDVVKLADLRKAVSWSEVRNVACYPFEGEDKKVEYYAHQTDVPFVPIKLTSTMSATMKDRYFNISLSEELDDYLEKWLI